MDALTTANKAKLAATCDLFCGEHGGTGSYTSVCAGGMFSPYPRQSVLIERSTWRFAAGFAGDETSVTWYRDPQYRRCE
jgi:hypothetical protein